MVRTVTVRPDRITGAEDVVVVPLSAGSRHFGPATAALDRACRSAVSEYVKSRRFRCDLGETALIPLRIARAPKYVLLVGLGPAGKLSPERIANAAGAAAGELDRRAFRAVAALVSDAGRDDPARFVHAFVKGFGLALYRYSLEEKPARTSQLRRLVLLADGDRKGLADVARTAQIVVEHTEILRDMVNAPANTMTPTILASSARALCREHGVACRVIGAGDIEKARMGAILGVARGSREEPKLIVMHYNRSRGDLPAVCLVGKGVTFDSGGISIKPWERMNEMKGDMAGGGLVISTVTAAARLGLPLQVIGVVPCVENMPGGNALKPGDVITTYSGKTIEIISTDAEGRLILSDALTYVRRHFDPVVTVDFATLTGAVLIALGTRIAGVMGNSQHHIDALLAASAEAGEPAWQLPLDDEFYDAVKGDITDYKNYSGRNASSITAAALLGRFAGSEPWIHVDIAGTFWSEGRGISYQRKGGTGYGVDLTLRFLQRLAGSS